jgi:hypothetical protein
MISGKKTVPCLILPVLKGLLVNEFCHDCAVFDDTVSNIQKARQ